MIRIQLTIAYKGGAVVKVNDVIEFKFQRGKNISWTTSGYRTTILTMDIDEIAHVHAERKLRPLTTAIDTIYKAVDLLTFWK